MTKLEQCLRLVYAIDPDGSIETRYEDYTDHPCPRFDGPVFFASACRDPDGDPDADNIADGYGATFEEAIYALHRELQVIAVRMRIALDTFEFEEASEPEGGDK